MMNSFKVDYICLLQTQVEEEIKYLLRMGHDHDLISNPCVFCYKAIETSGENKYRCNRLTELRNFVAQLERMAARDSEKGVATPRQHYYTNSMRRSIGQTVAVCEEVKTISQSGLLPTIDVDLKF
jgi:hypothetical protein